jgi:hypothetical protein
MEQKVLEEIGKREAFDDLVAYINKRIQELSPLVNKYVSECKSAGKDTGVVPGLLTDQEYIDLFSLAQSIDYGLMLDSDLNPQRKPLERHFELEHFLLAVAACKYMPSFELIYVTFVDAQAILDRKQGEV